MIRFLILALFVLCAPAKAQDNGRPATQVFATPARETDFADKVEALGTLKANESIVLTANTTDTIRTVDFKDGQRVEKGDILATMANAEERALLAEARSTAEEARQQLERTEPLVKQGAVSQAIFDQRQREYETAIARMRAVESRMRDRLIIAPFSGVVGLRNISVGALVQPGTPITTLHDNSVMKLDFNVPAVFLPALKEGLPITAKATAFGDREFKGEVSAIDSQIDPVTRSITVRAILPNEGEVLKPGLLMSVALYKNQRQALVIPEKALVSEADKTYVFVIEERDGQTVAVKRFVTIGSRRVGEVEIIDGLKAGEMIVSEGMMKISDGEAITVAAVDQGDETLRQLLSEEPQQPRADNRVP